MLTSSAPLHRTSNMPFTVDLKGKNVLLTGGGRGLGVDIARSLAEAGANIALTCAFNPFNLSYTSRGEVDLPVSLQTTAPPPTRSPPTSPRSLASRLEATRCPPRAHRLSMRPFSSSPRRWER